jgi:hypothetical protein
MCPQVQCHPGVRRRGLRAVVEDRWTVAGLGSLVVVIASPWRALGSGEQFAGEAFAHARQPTRPGSRPVQVSGRSGAYPGVKLLGTTWTGRHEADGRLEKSLVDGLDGTGWTIRKGLWSRMLQVRVLPPEPRSPCSTGTAQVHLGLPRFYAWCSTPAGTPVEGARPLSDSPVPLGLVTRRRGALVCEPLDIVIYGRRRRPAQKRS